MTGVATLTGASSSYFIDWESIDWSVVEKQVVRLQVRIAKAIRENVVRTNKASFILKSPLIVTIQIA